MSRYRYLLQADDYTDIDTTETIVELRCVTCGVTFYVRMLQGDMDKLTAFEECEECYRNA
jgi:uncharacterized radical SAM superfamily protein